LLLLYGAGLRHSEALALTLADVDLAEALITIRETKFHKTRTVPLPPRLNDEMRCYLESRLRVRHPRTSDSSFFVLRNGARVPGYLVDQAFSRLRKYVGISRSDGGRFQPRLHDLRHSFAVHRLTAWYREGANVQALLPCLSTYLGHVGLAGTQVYLSMTPELLQEAGKRFEQYASTEDHND